MSIFKIPRNTDMAAVAADWDRSATARQNRADSLTAKGSTAEAGPWRTRAREAGECAAAARQGPDAYEAHVNGW
ncbi:hypothetical protein ACH5AU_07915 [Streptomyces albidoflavus]